MFSEANFMEQDSSKNRLALVKTNRVSNQLYLRKMNQYQLLNKTKNN